MVHLKRLRLNRSPLINLHILCHSFLKVFVFLIFMRNAFFCPSNARRRGGEEELYDASREDMLENGVGSWLLPAEAQPSCLTWFRIGRLHVQFKLCCRMHVKQECGFCVRTFYAQQSKWMMEVTDLGSRNG